MALPKDAMGRLAAAIVESAATPGQGGLVLFNVDGNPFNSSALVSASVENTRPANTTAYTALDAVGTDIAISDATTASPIVVTSAAHGLADGDPVTIASVGGNTNANGNFYAKVTGYSATTFALYSDAALVTPVAGNSAYTSGGALYKLLKFSSLARIIGGSGYITKALLATDQKTNTARFRLHLFNAPPTIIADNSPYLSLYANVASRVGVIDFPALVTEDATNSTQATGVLIPGSGNLPLAFITAADKNLYGLLETLDAFTPASGQKITVKLFADQN